MQTRVNCTLLWALSAPFLLCVCAQRPDAERIKADLLGRQIGDQLFGPSYRFDSLSEYESFDIIQSNEAGGALEYTVNAVLKAKAGRCYATLNIFYRKDGGEWKLANLTDSRTLKCPRA